MCIDVTWLRMALLVKMMSCCHRLDGNSFGRWLFERTVETGILVIAMFGSILIARACHDDDDDVVK
jgi:hypothetical protein